VAPSCLAAEGGVGEDAMSERGGLQNFLQASELSATAKSLGETSKDGTQRYVASRVGRSYDQAVNCTHEWTNGVMRSQLDCWRVPKTASRQRILHTTSQMIDTPLRQKASRYLNDYVTEHGTDIAPRKHDKFKGTTLKMDHRQQWVCEPTKRSRSLAEDRPWLPPWVTNNQWDLAAQPTPPRWAGVPWAVTDRNGPTLWSGGSQPASRQGLGRPRSSTPSHCSTPSLH